jgi:DNA-binding protein HU-beta
MAEGDKVQLIGFGTFETRERSAKTAKNPRTGEAVEVPACKAPAFKAGKALKELVNK